MDEARLQRDIITRLGALEIERKRGWDYHWLDLAKHFCPRRARFLDSGDETNRGDRVNYLEDNIGILSLRTLASGMQSGLTSPARPWFTLSLQDAALAETPTVKTWLHDCQKIMVNAFARSNFYESVHQLYSEAGCFGTGVMFVESDHRASFVCETLPIGSYALDIDKMRRVDTIYRRIEMSARQIAEQWPDRCPEYIKDMAARGTTEWLQVLHAVEPNPQYQEGAVNARQRRYRSVFMILAGASSSIAANAGGRANQILEVGGYYEFPALCPRWSVTGGDVYGSSPAMDALGDVRQLQSIIRDRNEIIEKNSNPPMIGDSVDLDLRPGAMNVSKGLIQGEEVVRPLWQSNFRVNDMQLVIEQIKEQTRETFFVNLFMAMLATDRTKSATEASIMDSEKMLLLGPVLDRFRAEFFQPLTERVWGIESRRGSFPPPPDEVRGQEIKVEFVSILAQEQKKIGIRAIQNLYEITGMMAQITGSPEPVYKLNPRDTVDDIANMLGVSPGLINSDEEVAERLAADAQKAQQMQQMQMAQEMAKTFADGARGARDAGLTPEQQAAMQDQGATI